jgi:7-cyano-7-deazaguanine synthase in queuosine biosynthesis
MAQDSYSYDLSNAGSYAFDGRSHFTSTILDAQRYYLDDSRLVSPYGYTNPLVVADLLDVAAAVMWADRRSPRPRNYGRFRQLRGWVRHFDIILGVRVPEVWNHPPVKEHIEQLLGWLTEDTWQISFVHQTVRRLSDIRPTLFSSPPTDALVVLYSGGLDSLAGVVKLLNVYPEKSVMLLSVVSPRLSGILKDQTAELQGIFGQERVQCTLLPFHLLHDAPRRGEEQSQRARGFLFLSFGVAEAFAYNASRVISCENGVGMLNLPFNKRQLGTQHTRAMHPRTIVEMSELLSLLGLTAVRCEAPYLALTKAEVCGELREAGLGSLCVSTISCDSFPLRIPPNPRAPEREWHCGECTSCLLRRQAIFAAHLEAYDPSFLYQYDVCSPPSGSENRKLEPLKMMLDQVALIKSACNSFKPELNLLLTFPELLTARLAVEQDPNVFGLPQRIDSMEVFVRLFRQYAEEWDLFPYQLGFV